MTGTIRMTLGEILNTCDDWDKFCEDKGYSVWAVNEGGGHIEVSMSVEEAAEYGIIDIPERNQ